MSNIYENPGLEGNPHFVDATALPDDLVSASATLALAYEQRTTTLVALLVAGYETVQIAGIDYSELADEIKTRIGAVQE